MTVQWGDTGRSTFGTLKTLNISPYVSESNLTSTALPVGASASAVPASPVVTFTINTSTMAPTFSGVTVQSYRAQYGFAVSGQNTNGASQTVYYQVNKNGASYKTGNLSVTNNNYWTVAMFDGTLVNGDKLDFYVWTPASSGVNYFYQCIFSQPGRVDTGANQVVNLVYNVAPFAASTYFPLTGKVAAGAQANNYASLAIYNSSGTLGNANLGMYTSVNSTVSTSFPVTAIGVNKLFYTQAGDGSGTYSDIRQSSTSYPQLDCNYQVTSISYRDLFY